MLEFNFNNFIVDYTGGYKMINMEKMFSVLQAFASSEESKKLLRYVDEIEEYIDSDFSEEEYGESIAQIRDLIVRTNESLWRVYFREPADKEEMEELDKQVFTAKKIGDVPEALRTE